MKKYFALMGFVLISVILAATCAWAVEFITIASGGVGSLDRKSVV